MAASYNSLNCRRSESYIRVSPKNTLSIDSNSAGNVLPFSQFLMVRGDAPISPASLLLFQMRPISPGRPSGRVPFLIWKRKSSANTELHSSLFPMSVPFPLLSVLFRRLPSVA